MFFSDASATYADDFDGVHADPQGEDVFFLRDGTLKLVSTGPASFGGRRVAASVCSTSGRHPRWL